MNHSRALFAVISGLLSHLRHPPSRPRQSWTQTIVSEKDLSALIISLHTAWRRAQGREQWRQTVEASMLHNGFALDDDDDDSSS